MERKQRIDTTSLQAELASGSQAALQKLYELFSERLFHFSFAVLHSRELADEVVADVFIQIWQKRERVLSIDNLLWYLFTTTKNISLNYLRKEQKQKHIDIDAIVLPYYTVEPAAIGHLATAELLQLLTKAINDLPPRCRLIFKLIKEDGLKYKEVADLLHISLKTVENQMGIAIKKLHTNVQVVLPSYTIKQKL